MDFPHVVESPSPTADLKSWLRDNQQLVDSVLLDSGAILLRGFGVTGVEDFHDLAQVPLGELMQYVEGASPRVSLGAGVYTSTEYAPELTVAMHNELSYSHQWPARVAFYCKTPAERGGRTPIADSRKVYARMVDESPAPLPVKVRYKRQMHDGKGFGVAWPTVYGTSDRAAIETYCRAAGIDFRWHPDGSLGTEQVRPAAIMHPRTGERVWFNQAHQWHPSNGGEESEATLRELFGDALPMNAVLPGGQEIDRQVLKTARGAYEAEMVGFDWQAGDVMIIDNMLTAHGRTPFEGQREVFVAMGTPVGLETVSQVSSYA